MEPLEDRRLLATYTVFHSADDLSPGSLRLAIIEANANPGADTIRNYAPDGIGGTISYPINLTLGGIQLPTVTDHVAIEAQGQFTVSGNDVSRVLSINSGVTVSLAGMTFTNGNAASGNGGAIHNQGALSLFSMTIRESEAVSGGGIYSTGALNITGSSISDNRADRGGGVFHTGPTLNVTDSVIAGNDVVPASGVAQGGGIFVLGGTTTLERTVVQFNRAIGGNRTQGLAGFAGEGGGLYMQDTTLMLEDTTIRSNEARGGSGGVGAAGNTGTDAPAIPVGAEGGRGGDAGNGAAGGQGAGGGVYLVGSTATSLGSTISENVATGGTGGAGGTGGTGGKGSAGRSAVPDLFGISVAFHATAGGRGGEGGNGGVGGAGGQAVGGGVYLRSGELNTFNSTLAGNQVEGGRGGVAGTGGTGGPGANGGNGVDVHGSISFGNSSPGGDGGAGGAGGPGGQGGVGGESRGGGLERVEGRMFGILTTVAHNQIVVGQGGAGGVRAPGGSGGSGGVSRGGPVVGPPTPNGAPGASGPFGSFSVSGSAGVSSGGGLSVGNAANTFQYVILGNTLVAGNTAAGAPSDVSGTLDPSSTSNLFGVGGAGGLTGGVDGNLVGIADPRLGPLANNGGLTPTVALQHDSPAVNSGNNAFTLNHELLPLVADQRGAGFPRIVGTRVDIGAFESSFGAESLLVTTLADEDNGFSNPALGTGTSLREAIAWANLHSGADAITFAPWLAGGTITLGGTQLPTITGELSITGLGTSAPPISGNQASRVFEIAAGADVEMSGLTIRDGAAVTGGGIRNHGKLRITHSAIISNRANGGAAQGGGAGISSTGALDVEYCTFVDNIGGAFGGAIRVASPSGSFDLSLLTVRYSTFSGNSSRNGGALGLERGGALIVGSAFNGNSAVNGSGGAMNVEDASLTVTGSTVSGNSTTDRGGGIAARGQLIVQNSTIVDNSGPSGAGIRTDLNGAVTLTHSIVARNWNGSTPSDLVVGSIGATGGYNLIGHAATAGGLVHGVNGNIVGVDPKLGPLADNGGPTKTYTPLPGSPVIDAGDPFYNAAAMLFDQRGATFPRFVPATAGPTTDYVGLGEIKFRSTSGTVVTPEAAFASTYFSAQQSPTNLVNGSGLDANSGDVLSYTHTPHASAAGMWHAGAGQGIGGAPPQVADQYVVIDLGSAYGLSSAYLWQMVQQNALFRGLKEFRLLASPNAPNPADAANPPAVYDLTGYTEILGATQLAASAEAVNSPIQVFALTGATNVRTIYLDVISSYSTGGRVDIGAVEYRLDGDYDLSASVNGNDFLAWQRQLGSAANPHGSGADGNRDGTVDAADLDVWRGRFPQAATTAAALASVLTTPASAETPAAVVAVDDVALAADVKAAPAFIDMALTTLASWEAPPRQGVESRLKAPRSPRAEFHADVVPDVVRVLASRPQPAETCRNVDLGFDELGADEAGDVAADELTPAPLHWRGKLL
jgi:fibronectin-binding autotransporter adhesin